MTKQQITEQNEAIGRNMFASFNDGQTTQWNIHRWSKKPSSSWDVSYITGSTENNTLGYVIGEIKFRVEYKSTAYQTWILEKKKHDALQELKKQMQEKYPDRNFYVHYICFYPDKPNVPRLWDITNLNGDYNGFGLPANSNTPNPKEVQKPTHFLHNNEAINL